MTVAEPIVRRWSREEYYRLGEQGYFDGQRVELIDGEIVQMAPQKDVHSAVFSLAYRAIEPAFGPTYWTRMQLPLELPNDSEPDPDISVVSGSPRDFIGTGHPRNAILIVEVSDTTLLYDQRVKSSLYASAAFPEYWIVNLIVQRVEVHRQPRPDAADWKNSRYDDVRFFTRGQSITPLAAAQSPINVADLLP